VARRSGTVNCCSVTRRGEVEIRQDFRLPRTEQLFSCFPERKSRDRDRFIDCHRLLSTRHPTTTPSVFRTVSFTTAHSNPTLRKDLEEENKLFDCLQPPNWRSFGTRRATTQGYNRLQKKIGIHSSAAIRLSHILVKSFQSFFRLVGKLFNFSGQPADFSSSVTFSSRKYGVSIHIVHFSRRSRLTHL